LLKQAGEKGFVVYDFLLNNAIEAYTVPNMIPLCLGVSKETFDVVFKGKHIDKAPDEYIEYQRKFSLWAHYKKMGFVTVTSSDATADHIAHIFEESSLLTTR